MVRSETSESERPGTVSWPLRFSAAAEKLAGATSVADLLGCAVEVAPEVVAGADVAAVTVRGDDGSFRGPAAGLPPARALEELQHVLDEGPSVLVARLSVSGVVESADVATDPLFPRWGPAAVAQGIGAVLAVGFFPHRHAPRGLVLTLYSREAGGLTEVERDLAVVLAAHVSSTVELRRALDVVEQENAQLREALESRDIIGQAKGVLMQRQGIGPDEAFAMLRSASQSTNVKLHEIAQTLIRRRSDL